MNKEETSKTTQWIALAALGLSVVGILIAISTNRGGGTVLCTTGIETFTGQMERLSNGQKLVKRPIGTAEFRYLSMNDGTFVDQRDYDSARRGDPKKRFKCE